MKSEEKEDSGGLNKGGGRQRALNVRQSGTKQIKAMFRLPEMSQLKIEPLFP